MNLNFYSYKPKSSVSYPVFVYEMLVQTENDRFDILGRTILSYLSTKSTASIPALMRDLGIPDAYKTLVECELAELKSYSKIDEENNVIDCELNVKDYKRIYVFYDRVNGKVLPYLADEEMFQKALRLGRFAGALEEVRYKITKPQISDISELKHIINDYSNIKNKIEGSSFDNCEELQLIELENNLELQEVCNLHNPMSMNLILEVCLKEDELQYKDPFSNQISVYFKRTLEENTELERIKNRMVIESTSELLEKDSEIYKEDIKRRLSGVSKLDKDNLLKNMLEIRFKLNNLEKLSEVKENKFLSLDYEIVVINKLDEAIQSILKEVLEYIGVSNITINNGSIGKYITYEQEQKIPQQYDYLYRELKSVRVQLSEGKKLTDTIELRSIFSYYVLFGIAYFTLNKEDISNYIVTNMSEDTALFNTIEDIRMYRNNTIHRIGTSKKQHNEKYNLSTMHIKNKIEILKQLEEGTYKLIEFFDEQISKASRA